MSVDLKIRMDTSEVVTAGAAAERAVGGVEDATDRASDAMGRFAKAGGEAGASVAQGGQRAAGSLAELTAIAERLGRETVSVSRASVEAAEALERAAAAGVAGTNRQLEVLERILGPAREYNADVNALNALMAQGKVNAAQYDTELERLNAQFAAMHGPVSQIAERDAAAIERIRGPMQRYEQEVATLARLMDQGRITAAEYETELEKQAKRAGVWQGPVQQPGGSGAASPEPTDASGSLASALGTGGALLAGGAVGAAVVGLGEHIQGLIDRYHDVQDVAIEAGNAALKFADANHSVNLVIDEQIALAHDLHSNFRATIDVYDAVRDGTDDLNVSHADQIRLTKSLGEEVQIAGKSLESAGGLITRFSYALASGRIEARELKGIMREVPDIADTWTKHFDTTRQGLMEMVKAGAVSTEDLMRALIDEGAAIDANFAKRERTNKQKLEEWELNEKLLSQRYGVSYGAGHNYQAGIDQAAAQAKAGPEAYDRLVEASNINIPGLVSGDQAKAALQQIHDANASALGETVDQFKNLTGAFQTIGDAYRKYVGDTAAVRAEVQKLTEPMTAARNEIGVLNQAFAAGKIDVEDYDKRYQELQTTLRRGIPDEAYRIKKPIEDARKSLALLETERASGAIDSVEAYNKRRLELETTIHGGRTPEDLRITAPIAQAKIELAELQSKMRDLGGDTVAVRKRYDELMTTINDGRLPEAIKIWESIHDPIAQFGRDTRAAHALLQAGRITLAEYNIELQKLISGFAGADIEKLFNFREVPYKPNSEASQFAAYQGQIQREQARDVIGERSIEPARAYEQKLKDIAAAVKQFGIGQEVATSLQREARDAYDSSASSLDKVTVQVAGYQAALAKLAALRDAGQLTDEQFQAGVSQLSSAAKIVEQFHAPLVAYRHTLDDIQAAVRDFGLTQQQATFLERQARDEWEKAEESLGKVKTPLQAYQEQVRRLGEQLEGDALSAAKYDDAIDKARVTLLEATGANKTFAGGIEIEWIKLKDAASSFGATVATTLVGDVDKLNQAIVTAANGGRVAWGDMVDAMIQDLERLILKQLEVAAINAVIGAVTGGASTAVVGSLAEQFPHGGGSGPITSPSDISARAAPGAMSAPTPPAYHYPVMPTSSSSGPASGNGPVIVQIHNHYDQAVVHAAMDSPAGQKIILNTLRANQGAVRSYSGTRGT